MYPVSYVEYFGSYLLPVHMSHSGIQMFFKAQSKEKKAQGAKPEGWFS